jgi:sarcosine oxidase subunit gamma
VLVKPNIRLNDLETQSRLGIRGKQTSRWLQARAYKDPQECNHALLQADGSLISRLSSMELLWLDNPQRPIGLPVGIFQEDHQCYTVSRRDSHAWFMLKGWDAPKIFARLCGVDLSVEQFTNLAVAQTSIAKISGIIIRSDAANIPVYHLLADSSYHAYLWRVLTDAAEHY